MAGMTPTQVEQIVNAQQQDGGGSGLGDSSGGSTGGTSGYGDWRDHVDLNERQQLAFSDPNLYQRIFDTRTSGEDAAYAAYGAGWGDPTTELSVLSAGDNYGEWAKHEISVVNPTARGGNSNLPPTTLQFGHGLYEWRQNPWSKQWELQQIGQSDAAGSGSDHYAADRQAEVELANLEEKKREFGLTFPESQREFDLQQHLATQTQQANVLQDRAKTGLEVGNLQRGLAQDSYQRANDPGNFPAYLAASAGLPRGSGSPIDQLLGNGVQIAQPEGGNPLADPRFKNLMDQLYGYAQPQNISTVQNIAANNGGTLPQSFYDYTGTQAPAHAQGGSQMLHEPVIAIGMHTGRPAFIAGEAGDERVDFTPAVHSHSDGGQPIPHSHDRGDQKHEHMDANSPAVYGDGGTAQIQPYDSSTNDPMQGQTQYPTGTQKALPTTATPTATGPASGVSGPIGGGGLAGGSTSPVGSAANGTYSWDQPDPNMQRVSDAYARDPAAAQRFFSQSPTNLQQMFGQSNPQDFWNQYAGYTADQKARLQTIAQNGGLTPAQGTNIALGKGLQAMGWVNNNLVQHLLTGDSPTPGMIDDQTLMRLPPSYRALLQAAIRAQVGSAGLGDYAQSQQDFAMPGLGSSYPTASYA